MPIGPSQSSDARSWSPRDAGSESLFESLERRVLLSSVEPGFLPGALGEVEWLGHSVEAIQGSYVLNFPEQRSSGGAEAAALQAASELGVSVDSVSAIGLGHNARLTTHEPISPEAARALAESSAWLNSLVPDMVAEDQAAPNDAQFPQQWAMNNTGQEVGQPGEFGADINVVPAWDETVGSRDTVVAVIDTGFDLDHPDLEDNIWVNPGEIPGNGVDDDGNGFVDDVNGFDFANLDPDPSPAPVGSPGRGHGTQVAGLVGAVGDNDIGISGVAQSVSIMPLRAATDFGGLPLSATVGAIDYVTMMREQQGVNIVAANASYGLIADFELEEFRGAEKDAIERLIDSGAVFVAAAGNDSTNIDPIPEDERTQFPAGYDLPGIVSVAATDNQDQLAAFSNTGVQSVDLAAPGQFVLTTQVGGGYGRTSGTSFSAPLVSGAVALMKTIRPGASGAEVRQVLNDSADTLPSLQNQVQSSGRLNVAEALRQLTIDGPVVTAFEPGPVTGQLDAQGEVVDTLAVTFNRALDEGLVDQSAVEVVGAGSDGEFGTGDDVSIPLDGVSLAAPARLEIGLDLFSFPQQRLPVDAYRLTLAASGFRDTDGNFLNGGASEGMDEQIAFEVAAASGENEPNDTIGTATALPSFSGSGQATINGQEIGDGLQAGSDVDLFEIDIPRGGLIRAEIIAQNRAGGSELDSFLRLFNNAAEELVSNDQFNGQDALVDFFVPTGGTYYIGVSGFPNRDYDPASLVGRVSGSTGVYDLSISVDLIQEDRITADRDLSDEPKRIPAAGTQGVTSDQLQFNDARQILDLNVSVDIAHEASRDLEISLIGPSGTQVLLADRPGSGGADFDGTVFDDEASQPIGGGSAPFDGQFQPVGSLSSFDGESAAGQWTLLIRDRVALNTGALEGWSLDFTLENNIFGPFESNDTLQTARELEGIDGTGSTTVEAAIGDGGFGALDRDLFRIDVASGSTLRAELTPQVANPDDPNATPPLDGALRLFDADGNELLSANPSGTQSAVLDEFVFVNGGAFYLGVSDSANIDYDPFRVGSGTPSQSTGDFSLNVVVNPGVTDGPRTLAGQDLSVGFGGDGTFLGGGTGLRFGGTEFLFGPEGPGAGAHFFGAAADGLTFKNDGPGGESGTPLALTDQSDVQNRRLVAETIFEGLGLQRAVTFGRDDSFAAVDIRMTNTSASAIEGINFMEALNPDQGLNTSPGTSASTVNGINGAGTLLTASFSNTQFPEGLTIGLAHARAEQFDAGGSMVGTYDPFATFFDPEARVVRDAAQLIDGPMDQSDGDRAMSLSYDVGSLGVGESVEMRYFLLFGTDQEVQQTFSTLESGMGTGHLAADPANPASETLQTADGDSDDQAPTLPFRSYFPEGFANSGTSTFVPVANPNDRATRVVVIARYETGARDEILGDLTIEPNARSGLTITRPDLFQQGESLVRPTTPFSIEVRSEVPVASSFSHYDEFLIEGGQAGIGDSFINRADPVWTFGEVQKGSQLRDFILLQNTTDVEVKTTFTFFSESGETYEATIETGAQRRGGLDVQNATLEGGGTLPEGSYGVRLEAEGEIIASLSHFNTGTSGAFAAAGVPGGGSLRGVTPEGQLGLRANEERLGVLNTNPGPADVVLSFVFANGTTFRSEVEVPGESRAGVSVDQLPNFPVGQPYSVSFESDVPVSMILPTTAMGDEFASSFSDDAYTLWSFGEGFRPANGSSVDEYLRLYNPSSEDVLAEITLEFDKGLGQETFRRTLPGGRVSEFDLFEFVTGEDRRSERVFYSITVKAAEPIVAYMGHFDQFFPGGFGMLGTPLGTPTPLS